MMKLGSMLLELICLIEVRAMVMAVQQPLAECIVIFTLCIVEHHLPLCAVTIPKIAQLQDSVRIQDQMAVCLLHTHHLDLSQEDEKQSHPAKTGSDRFFDVSEILSVPLNG